MILKTKKLRQNIVLIKPTSANFVNNIDITEEIKKFISENKNLNNIILDLTELNFLNSVKIGVLAATYHFVEFIGGKIYIVISDNEAKKFIEILSLKNVVVVHNENQLYLDNIA